MREREREGERARENERNNVANGRRRERKRERYIDGGGMDKRVYVLCMWRRKWTMLINLTMALKTFSGTPLPLPGKLFMVIKKMSRAL